MCCVDLGWRKMGDPKPGVCVRVVKEADLSSAARLCAQVRSLSHPVGCLCFALQCRARRSQSKKTRKQKVSVCFVMFECKTIF